MTMLSLVASVIIYVLFMGVVLRVAIYTNNVRDGFHPIALLAIGVTYLYVIPSLYLLITRNYSFDHTSPLISTISALVMAVAFFTVTSIAYMSTPRIKIRLKLKDLNTQFIFFMSLASIVLGFIGYLSYVFMNGGLVRLLTIEYRTNFLITPNTLRYKLLAFIGFFGGLPLLLPSSHQIYQDLSDNRKRHFIFFVGVLISGVILAVLSFRSRLKLTYPIFALVVYLHYYIKRVRAKSVLILSIIAFIGMGLFSAIEYLLLNEGSQLINILFRGVVYQSRFEPLIAVLSKTDSSMYTFGKTFFYGGSWIETGVTSLGNRVEILLTGHNQSNWTVSGTVLSEMYLNYGIPGVLLFSLVYSIILKLVYTTFIESTTPIAGGAYIPIIFSILVMVPTSVGWAFRNFVMTSVPPLIFIMGLGWLYTR